MYLRTSVLVEHGELHVRLQREAPSTGIPVHQTLRGGGGWGENAVLDLQDSPTVDPDPTHPFLAEAHYSPCLLGPSLAKCIG